METTFNASEASLFWCESVQDAGAIPQIEEGAFCACVGCGCAGCGAVPEDEPESV
jgi:hypothetical protein